ncbi:helix-turn-helix domain-containing protein [Streptomyces sp. BBFR2]|uniref:helix-turn-helix domain-containing protein n=1 Tax=Streptomyces sp. BBFR2 TaxID=3372854 RepID=UPI0037DA3EFB
MEQASRQFAAWLREELIHRGYDLSARGGGQTKFAERSGIGRATISRLLSGTGSPDTRSLGLLATALGLPLGEVLVRAGILDRSELKAVRTPATGDERITPEQAADELGIRDTQARRLFVSMTKTLQRPSPDNGDQQAAEQ